MWKPPCTAVCVKGVQSRAAHEEHAIMRNCADVFSLSPTTIGFNCMVADGMMHLSLLWMRASLSKNRTRLGVGLSYFQGP